MCKFYRLYDILKKIVPFFFSEKKKGHGFKTTSTTLILKGIFLCKLVNACSYNIFTCIQVHDKKERDN